MIPSSFSIDYLTRKTSLGNYYTKQDTTIGQEQYMHRRESDPGIQRHRLDSPNLGDLSQKTALMPTTSTDVYRNRIHSSDHDEFKESAESANFDSYRTRLESLSSIDSMAAATEFYRNRLDSGIGMEPYRNRLSSLGLEAYRSRIGSVGMEPLRNQIHSMGMGLVENKKDSNINNEPNVPYVPQESGSDDSFRRTPSPSNSEGSNGNTNENTESIAQVLLTLDKTIKGNFVSDSAEKPHHSYIALISMAILASPEKKALLCDIYKFIMDSFQYYNNKEKAWRNSIRHNLSLNECFVKNGRSDNGKGNYWSIHPACVEDFGKGDFRRRQARRRARKSMKETDIFEAGVVARRMNPFGYVAMTSAPVGYSSYQPQPPTSDGMYMPQTSAGAIPSQTMTHSHSFQMQNCNPPEYTNTPMSQVHKQLPQQFHSW